jgi:hypothetical protein
MTDEQVDLLNEKIVFLEKQLIQKDDKKTSMDDYLRELKLYGDTPKDQFSHQYKLLYHPSVEINTRSKRVDLFNPDILLGNIKDSKTLYFFQRDFSILHRIYDMGLRSEGVMDLFNNLYYAWIGQIRLTGALTGNERLLQSFLEPVLSQSEGFSFLEKHKVEKEKKKRLRDYMAQAGLGRGAGGGGGGQGGGVYG